MSSGDYGPFVGFEVENATAALGQTVVCLKLIAEEEGKSLIVYLAPEDAIVVGHAMVKKSHEALG